MFETPPLAPSIADVAEAHLRLVDEDGLSCNAAGVVTGHSRATVRRNVERLRAIHEGRVPDTVEERRQIHYRMVRLDGASLTAAARQTGSTSTIVREDLEIIDVEVGVCGRFEEICRAAERLHGTVLPLPAWWRDVPPMAADAGLDDRWLTGILSEAAYRVAHGRMAPYTAIPWVAGAVRREAGLPRWREVSA